MSARLIRNLSVIGSLLGRGCVPPVPTGPGGGGWSGNKSVIEFEVFTGNQDSFDDSLVKIDLHMINPKIITELAECGIFAEAVLCNGFHLQ